MRVYLNRFLNIPAAHLPPDQTDQEPKGLSQKLPMLLDQQQQVNEAGEVVARYLFSGGHPKRLLSLLGKLLLREDHNFHTIQVIEAAFQQYELLTKPLLECISWLRQPDIWLLTRLRCDRKDRPIKWLIVSTGAITCLRIS